MKIIYLHQSEESIVRLDYVHFSSYPSNSQSVVLNQLCIVDTFSFSSIKMAAMEFDEVYEEIRGVLVSLVY
jgi:hypothetical protein